MVTGWLRFYIRATWPDGSIDLESESPKAILPLVHLEPSLGRLIPQAKPGQEWLLKFRVHTVGGVGVGVTGVEDARLCGKGK